MTYFCETPGGEEDHINASDEAAAAERFVEWMVKDGVIGSGAPIYVRVTDHRCTSPKAYYFHVEYEMIPDADAHPCDGARLFDHEKKP